MCMSMFYEYIYIYMYIERERERERSGRNEPTHDDAPYLVLYFRYANLVIFARIGSGQKEAGGQKDSGGGGLLMQRAPLGILRQVRWFAPVRIYFLTACLHMQPSRRHAGHANSEV